MNITEKKAALVRCMISLTKGDQNPEIRALKSAHIQKQARAIYAECGEVFTSAGWVKP